MSLILPMSPPKAYIYLIKCPFPTPPIEGFYHDLNYIARHFSNRLYFLSDKASLCPYSGSSMCSLASGMSPADNDYVDVTTIPKENLS